MPTSFLRLDSSDVQYKEPLKNPVKNYFSAYNLPFEDAWTRKRTKGLSTKSYNFKDTTHIEDSLKTHPDCKERYSKTLAFSINHTQTPIPTTVKEKATKMVIWNIFDNLSLTACLYRILLEKDKGNSYEWYDFMIHNIFSGLLYSDNQLNRFNSIRVTPKEFISKDYYELQTMLEQMPKESLEQYCKYLNILSFWQKMPFDAKALKSLFYTLNFEKEPSDKTKEAAAKEFIANNSGSMFCEFANHFKK